MVEGEINNVLNDTVNRLNEKFPQDFVARIRDLDREGKRKTDPGAYDHWMEC